MAPQQKKTVSPKKIAAKKTSMKKTAPKKTATKKMATKKMVTKKISPKKKTATKKVAPKKTLPKTAPKKAALKKKIKTKRSAKVGEGLTKKDLAKGKKKMISRTAEERAARAARRSLTKEAPAVKEPLSKRVRLDSPSSDLINLLTTSAPVRDIFAASGSRHLPMPKEAEVIRYQDSRTVHISLLCDASYL